MSLAGDMDRCLYFCATCLLNVSQQRLLKGRSTGVLVDIELTLISPKFVVSHASI